jgi:lipoprotein NlpD
MTTDDPSSDSVVAPVEPVVESEPRELFVEVVRGDTLYSIARSHQLTPHQLARWNALRPPYEIYPGQKLRTRPPQAAYGSSPPSVIKQVKVEPVIQPDSIALPEEENLPATVNAWNWPVKGKIVKTFDKKDTSRKGIGIAGKPGQAIKATAAGKVVYSGNGLISYGNLIIIKHSNAFLSAYAYNKKLLVNEGDSVRSGQIIAHMGTIENGRSQLHFEIRKDGKPVNPLKFLPKI